MPPNTRSADFYLDDKPFMLSRQTPQRGRAWTRAGKPDTPSRRTIEDVRYGNLPDEIDHPEVWEDWSGGFGDYYRLPEHGNGFSYAQNFDGRFPKQLIHAQQPNLLDGRYASTNINVNFAIDVPLPGVATPPAGAGAVLLLGRQQITSLTPTNFPYTAGSAFDPVSEVNAQASLSFGNRPAVFGSYTYIPNQGNFSFNQRPHSGIGYSPGPVNAQWFQTASGRLWWANQRNYLTSVAVAVDPMNTANYAASIGIGNGFLRTDDAVANQDQIFCGMPDGLYQGSQTGTFNNALPDVGANVNIDNVRDLNVQNGGVVACAGAQIWWYQPSSGANSVTREIGPSGVTSNRSSLRGRFTCTAVGGKWLYAGLFTGSQSYLMAGRDASGDSPYVWTPLQLLPHTCKISRIHVDSISSSSGGVEIPNRIWIATEATFGAMAGATAPLYQFPIPRGDINPLADLAFSANYCGSARLDTPVADWQAPGTPKVFRLVEVWADNLASGSQYADVYYTIDGGPRTLLGRAQTSPKSILYFPSTTGSFTTGQTMQLSIESFTASLNVTPIYRAFIARGAARPNSIDTINAKVKIADNMLDRDDIPMRPGAQMLSELRTMSTSGVPHRLIDLAGAASWVVVLAPVNDHEFYQAAEDTPELEAELNMAVLDFSGGVP